MKKIAILALLLVSMNSTFAQNWKIDPSHTKISFSTKYLLITDVEGEFKDFSGTFTSAKPDFSDLTADVTVAVSSINTENEMRDNHLKSDVFFNAEKFPSIHFKSKGVRSLGKNKYMLKGELTIRDVTKTIDIPLVYGGTVKDSWGNIKAGFSATTVIDRKEYGLKYSDAAATGEAVVGDNVTFSINAVLIKQ